VLRIEKDSHVQVCPKVLTECPGKSRGCSFEDERAIVQEHAERCQKATIALTLEAAMEQFNDLRPSIHRLERRVTHMESEIGSLRETNLATSYSVNADTSRISLFPSHESRNLTDDQEQSISRLSCGINDLYSNLLSVREEIDSFTRLLTDTDNRIRDMDGRMAVEMVNFQTRHRNDMMMMSAQIHHLRMQSTSPARYGRLGDSLSSTVTNSTNITGAADLGQSHTSAELRPQVRRSSDGPDGYRQHTKL
jgi:hypothetical protein